MSAAKGDEDDKAVTWGQYILSPVVCGHKDKAALLRHDAINSIEQAVEADLVDGFTIDLQQTGRNVEQRERQRASCRAGKPRR